MCGKNLKIGSKIIFLCLLLLLLCFPVFSSNSSEYVQVEINDWTQINNYVKQQKLLLPELQNQLEGLQTELSQQKQLSESLSSQLLQAKFDLEIAKTQLQTSSETLTRLNKSLTSTTNEINALQSQNNWLKIGLGVSVGISIGCIAYIVITALK